MSVCLIVGFLFVCLFVCPEQDYGKRLLAVLAKPCRQCCRTQVRPCTQVQLESIFLGLGLDSKSLDSDLTNGLGLEMIRAAMSYGGIDICLL